VPLGAGNKRWHDGTYSVTVSDVPPVDQVTVNNEGYLNG
jgi:hypothetical protein